MSILKRTRPSGDGERAAISGYRPQYEVAASIILHHLRKGTLEWIKLADPDAGAIDDFQIATPGRLDAYQVKWSQYSSNVTYNSFISASKDKKAPLQQLAEGWQKLRELNPNRSVVVHWLTNDQPSPNDGANIPVNETKPTPCHFAAFLQQVIFSIKEKGEKAPQTPIQWRPALQEWLNSTQLSEKERIDFLHHCEFDLHFIRPIERPIHSVDDKHTVNQIRKLTEWLTEQVADSKRQIQFSSEEILNALGISELPGSSLKQNFPIDEKIYRPIESTTSELEQLIETTKGGYIALLGSPGSGKSTLLTQILRYKPVRLARYYAYVPNTRDISALRGESISFLGSIIHQFDALGFQAGHAVQTNDREALLQRLKSQIDLLHNEYTKNGKMVIILVDGLDHIHRELKPERSLLADLPRPEEIPEGIFILFGSQTLNLPDLPDVIRQYITNNQRFVTIGSLTRKHVFEITDTIGLPFKPKQSEYDLIYELSAGHPLSLRYLLEKLQKVRNRESANIILSNSALWGPDINQHYETHWNQIKPNEEMINFLGLICRIRGSIDLRWINTWPEANLLKIVEDQFGYLFRKESDIKWNLFHNSFRLFLIDKTRQIQPGLSPEELDGQYHAILAERCISNKNIPESSWNKIYHLERSGQHEQVLISLTQNGLREQLYGLRPIHSIWEDIFSGLKSTAVTQDPVALMRLILAGIELESREDALGELDVPEILINIGEYEKALLHIRDGYQLMVSESAGLKYASQLFDSGEITEATKVFELSEPIEYLSGSMALKIHPDHENTKILKRWVKAAVRFRSLSKILSVIPCIQATWEIENENLEKRNPSQETQDEMFLSLGKELILFERYDDFYVLLDYIDKNIDESFNISFKLLRTLWDNFYYNQQSEQAKKVLKQIEQYSGGHQLYEWQSLWIARTLAKSNGDKRKIKKLIAGVPLLQTPDNYYSTNYRPLDDLSWDMIHVGIKFFLDENTDLIKLVPDHPKPKYRGSVLFRRAVAAIGRIIGSFWKGELLNSAILRQTYSPILKLFYHDWTIDRDWLDWHSYRADSGRLYEYLIHAVQLHGDISLEELKKAFETEWDGENTKKYWYTPNIRTVILALWRAGISHTWTINRLEKLEHNMLIGHDISGRMDEFHEQINAWIDLGESDRVKSLLTTALNSTFGVGYRKDNQLDNWVKWYRKIANAVPDQALERYCRVAEAIPGLENTTEGQTSAAILLIKAVFDASPRRAVMLFFHFWKLTIISYQEGLSSLIQQALNTTNVNLKLVIPIFSKLLIPLSKSVPENIAKTLIDRNFLLNGRSDTINLGHEIIDSVDVLALSHIRPGLRYAIAQSLQKCGITEVAIANAPEPLAADGSYSPTDRTTLELKTGHKMTFKQVVDAISNAENFIKLFQEEEKYRLFDWASVIGQIFNKLQPHEIELLVKYFNEECKSWELLNAIAEQFLKHGNKSKARQVVMFSIQHIKDGHGYFYDRVNRLDTFELLKKIDHDEAIRQTYSFLISELVEDGASYIFRSLNKVLEDVFEIICEDIPYEELGNELDNYIEAIFANEQKTSIEFFNQEIQNDSVNRALADLVCENADHDVSIICQLAREVIIECIREDVPECINAIQDQLNSGVPTISMLIAIAQASKEVKKPLESLIPIIQRLSQNTNIFIAQIAQDIACNLSVEVPPIIPEDKISLPSIYSLVINENQAWDIWYEGDLKEGEELPDTQDPRELVKPNDLILKAASKESGIPFINLCMRAVRIVQEKGQEKLLSRSLEKQIRRRLEYTGLKMTYRRPRFRAMDPAILEVIGELVKAGRISYHSLTLFKELFHPYDPAFLAVNPVRRPEDITPISGIGDRMIELKDWVAKQPNNYTPENKIADFTILGEEAQIRRLTYGIPFEHRATACMFERTDEQKDLLFGRLVDCCVKEYLNSDLRNGHNCLVVRNESYKIETGQISWLAFNPLIAQQIRWNLKTDDWFHWVDENDDTMAKSIWWKDGLIQWYDTHLRENFVEVAEGWRVIISSRALAQLTERFKELIRINRVSRVCHQDDGTKHEKTYEWQNIV